MEVFIKSPTNHQRSRVAGALAALIVVVLAAAVFGSFIIARKSADQQQMEELASFVQETGQPTEVSAGKLAYFVLPVENPQFYELQELSEGGGTKAIQVRLRQNGARDVFLLDLLSNGTGSFYLSNDSGLLVQSAYFDDGVKPITDAQDKYKRELEFWKHWHSEKLKRP